MLVAFTLSLLASPMPASVAQANLAIEAFREACVQGSLKLSPERGRILKEDEITDLMRVWDWGRPMVQRTVVQLNGVPSSYLVFAEYKHLQPGSIGRSCTLVSKAVSQREGMAAFLEGLPDKDVHPKWIPDMYLPVWISDHPELGYRKEFAFRTSDPTIMLEVGLYPTAAAQK